LVIVLEIKEEGGGWHGKIPLQGEFGKGQDAGREGKVKSVSCNQRTIGRPRVIEPKYLHLNQTLAGGLE